MKKYIILLSLFFLVSCERPQSEHVKIVNKITNEYKKEVINQYSLVLLGEGGGMMGDIQRVSLTFNMYRALNLAEVRNLIVKLEERYLELINANTDVRPYLHEFPFGPQRFRLSLIFSSPVSNFVSSPNIASAVVSNGNVFYTTYNENKKNLDIILSEPYEDAYKIVYGQERSSRIELEAPQEIDENSNCGLRSNEYGSGSSCSLAHENL